MFYSLTLSLSPAYCALLQAPIKPAFPYFSLFSGFLSSFLLPHDILYRNYRLRIPNKRLRSSPLVLTKLLQVTRQPCKNTPQLSPSETQAQNEGHDRRYPEGKLDDMLATRCRVAITCVDRENWTTQGHAYLQLDPTAITSVHQAIAKDILDMQQHAMKEQLHAYERERKQREEEAQS
mgnify:CR=1 FL=1